MTSRLSLAVCGLALLGAGCTAAPATPVVAPPLDAPVSVGPTVSARVEPATTALSMVPESASVLSVTDYDRIRLQLGVPDLTSQDSMADRNDFWRRAETETALLSEPLLRSENSRLMLDYDFTQDDVDWEARFTGPEIGPTLSGYVLKFRPDLDMARVARAVDDRVGGLSGAEVLPRKHLVTFGAAAAGAPNWGADPALTELVGLPADSAYVERGCVSLEAALGDVDPVGAVGVAEREKLSALAEVAAFSISFEGLLATVRLGAERPDLFSRLALGEEWPARDPAFTEGFTGGVADPETGRIGYEIASAPVAAQLALTRTLPFAVCHQA